MEMQKKFKLLGIFVIFVLHMFNCSIFCLGKLVITFMYIFKFHTIKKDQQKTIYCSKGGTTKILNMYIKTVKFQNKNTNL